MRDAPNVNCVDYIPMFRGAANVAHAQTPRTQGTPGAGLGFCRARGIITRMNPEEDALDQPADWIAVAAVQGVTEGEIIAGRLRTAGIPAWISRESASSAIPVSYGLLGRFEVMVPVGRYDEAAALLAGGYEADEDDASLQDDGMTQLKDGENDR